MEEQKRNAYWRANIKLMLGLLSVWFLVSFGFGILFVDPPNIDLIFITIASIVLFPTPFLLDI